MTVKDYLGNSRFVAFLKRIQEKERSRSERVWHQVRVVSGQIEGWVEQCKRAPLRAGGIVLVSTVVTNALCVWVFQKEVGLWGKIFGAALLCAGLAGGACSGDWETIREGSLFLRFLFPRRGPGSKS